jgi:D-alanyl-lipoteichoic acid acyltransferase DltB (MBOAT superfamily)
MTFTGGDNFLNPIKFILPLGISFFVFLSISYIVDVYRKLIKPESQWIPYLTYVFFWPHMIAGPIVRANELIPQLKRTRVRFNLRFLSAFHYIICGLFLKVVLGDQLGIWVDEVYSSPLNILSKIDIISMAYGFGFQIYFDFAGYSMIAIGSAKLIGIRFPINFNWPYLASTPREFWQRWHITLSSWIRDYLYLPLRKIKVKSSSKGGFNLYSESIKDINFLAINSLFITWVIMGLWHGADWKFALWGIWHAVIILFYRLFRRINLNQFSSKILTPFSSILTIFLMMLGWLFFRAADTFTAFKYFEILLSLDSSFMKLSFRENFYLLIFLIYLLMPFSFVLYKIHSVALLVRNSVFLSLSILTHSFMCFMIILYWGGDRQFIYFQF